MQLEIINADITELAVDAIVNTASKTLLGGSGIDGAIHKKGGSAILDACMAIRSIKGGCKTGEAVITTAGNLPAKFVIHTVGPVWQSNNKIQETLLANCYTNCLWLAVSNNIKTIAFPNISTGVYRYPKKDAAKIAIQTVTNYAYNEKIDKVIFVCYDIENFDIYKNIITNT